MEHERPIEPPEIKEDEKNDSPYELKKWQLERAIIWAVDFIQELNDEVTEQEIFNELGFDGVDFKGMVERDDERRRQNIFKKLQLKK